MPQSRSGAFAPCRHSRKVQDILPSPVIAWIVDETGVKGIITPGKVFPAGSAIWGPEGIVEPEDGDWPSLQAYCKHLNQQIH